ncbi:hypothetical protein LCGC14_2941470 [marine sediment metagenome]|uniref:site-specific DNA-methyltransferase (cytosine-N(4)-specific) n=1 Tax=marine sediment metagenome TaxID=412755 RepID=A0A0F8Y4W5_9ZZZZ
MTGTAEIVRGDARDMGSLEDDSIDLIVTSPPYWGLRSYRDDGEHYAGQVGSEDTPQQYVDELVDAVNAVPPEHRSDYLAMIETHMKRAQLGGIS